MLTNDEPQPVLKNARRLPRFDAKVLSLYAPGMSVRARFKILVGAVPDRQRRTVTDALLEKETWSIVWSGKGRVAPARHGIELRHKGEHPYPRGYCANLRVPIMRGALGTTLEVALMMFGGLSGARL